MPGGRIEPSAPPNRDIILADGKPNIGSDKINFMLFLKATEEHIKEKRPDFFALLTKGYATEKKVIVSSAEHAIHMASEIPTTNTWRKPAKIWPRTQTQLPDELRERYHIMPERLDVIDQDAFNLIASFFTSKRTRDNLAKVSGNNGRRLVLALEQMRLDYVRDPDVNARITGFVTWLTTSGIPSPTVDSFDDWTEDLQLWNTSAAASSVLPDSLLSERIASCTRLLNRGPQHGPPQPSLGDMHTSHALTRDEGLEPTRRREHTQSAHTHWVHHIWHVHTGCTIYGIRRTR